MASGSTGTPQAQHACSESLSQIEVEKFFRQLQGKLSISWPTLATRCGFCSDEIKTIKIDQEQCEEQGFQMLCLFWKRKPTDWHTILIDGLEHPTVGRQDLVEDVQDFLNEGSNSNVASCSHGGPAAHTRSASSTNQVRPLTSRNNRSKLVLISKIKKKMSNNWYIKTWSNHMYDDKPQLGMNKFHFRASMTDRSEMNVFISFFLTDRRKCEDYYDIINKSSKLNPVCLTSMQVKLHAKKYRIKGGIKYKLIFNDRSEIQY